MAASGVIERSSALTPKLVNLVFEIAKLVAKVFSATGVSLDSVVVVSEVVLELTFSVVSAFEVSACVLLVEDVPASGVAVCVSTVPDDFVSVVELTGVAFALGVAVI